MSSSPNSHAAHTKTQPFVESPSRDLSYCQPQYVAPRQQNPFVEPPHTTNKNMHPLVENTPSDLEPRVDLAERVQTSADDPVVVAADNSTSANRYRPQHVKDVMISQITVGTERQSARIYVSVESQIVVWFRERLFEVPGLVYLASGQLPDNNATAHDREVQALKRQDQLKLKIGKGRLRKCNLKNFCHRYLAFLIVFSHDQPTGCLSACNVCRNRDLLLPIFL